MGFLRSFHFFIGPTCLPRFSVTPCLFRMRNTDDRLLKPLACQTSSMEYPAEYMLMTVCSRCSRLEAGVDTSTGGAVIRFCFSFTMWAADLRSTSTSSGSDPNISSTSEGFVSGNSSFRLSILSWMLMTRMTLMRQTSRNIASSRLPRRALENFAMTSSSPRSSEVINCFHWGRVFS